MTTPFTRTAVAQGVKALVAMLRKHAKTQADRAKLGTLMSQACQMRAARQCSTAELDRASEIFAATALALSLQGA
ncbi:MAG: hypothetical protein LBU72_08340 [Burkholderiaceae bacterium]|jgi:hypothetical protein|nr:hypothetical protein [Burkholderiaceae bacterium]